MDILVNKHESVIDWKEIHRDQKPKSYKSGANTELYGDSDHEYAIVPASVKWGKFETKCGLPRTMVARYPTRSSVGPTAFHKIGDGNKLESNEMVEQHLSFPSSIGRYLRYSEIGKLNWAELSWADGEIDRVARRVITKFGLYETQKRVPCIGEWWFIFPVQWQICLPGAQYPGAFTRPSPRNQLNGRNYV
jgi:hypothetical protein